MLFQHFFYFPFPYNFLYIIMPVPGILVDNILGYVGKRPMPYICLLYTSPSPRDKRQSRMPS
ncbi:hypothetical protein, partial [Methanosarcina sp. 2.H.T.1A.15]|uniref:hypothetical protein n=1 Tax=Methanosarcina sp. 2.H.T.1A.15 TaxID=1483596 RepID=UPI001F4903C5